MDDNKHMATNEAKAYGTFYGASMENQKEGDLDHVKNRKPTLIPPLFKIEREAMTQIALDHIAPPFKDENTFPDKVHSIFKSKFLISCACVTSFMKTAFPFLRWLPEYSIKNDLLLDVITGVTLLILHVPQGMAYAQLASVAPIYGLYTSFYPVLVYFFLGTSKHISIGTFAVSSLLAGSEVDEIIHLEYSNQQTFVDHYASMTNFTTNSTIPFPTPAGMAMHTRIQIAMIITFTVGVLQTAMGILRMGSLTAFMSDEMISAFITGTVVHVFTSQLKPLTGAIFMKYSGPFNIIFTWIALFKNISTVNYIVLLISICSLAFLIIVKEIINSFLLTKTKIPIPAELILVICGTVISKYLCLNECCQVDIVGLTPTGLMAPESPPFSLLPKVLTSSMVLSVVCATTTLSMVIIYAKKHEYEVDTNQELVAYGVAGILSSFFFCIPSCGSLSRSAMQESTGAKSQVAGLVSCILMLVVLLALGPLFESLPSCVLSAVIVMSLKSMLLHFGDLTRAWSVSKLDASVWLVTFLSVVILDMDYGLIIGILFSLITILFRSQNPETCLLGNLPGTEIYRSIDKYPNVAEIPGVKIFHFGASLYFSNRDYFRSQIFHLVSMQQRDTDIKYQNAKNEKALGAEGQLTFSKSCSDDNILRIIIIELSAVAYMDSGGVATLLQVIREFAVNNIEIYLANVQEPVIESLRNQGFFKILSENSLFPTTHDAVLFARNHGSNS